MGHPKLERQAGAHKQGGSNDSPYLPSLGCPIEHFYKTNTNARPKIIENLFERLFSCVQRTLGCV